MTPAARYAAAIAVLDDVLAGAYAEKCLTTWARGNRYAGSKDRAAVRDHVFDVLRRKRSLGALGGGETGRALIIGLLRHQGIDPDMIFGAGGYGPEALSDAELAGGRAPVGHEVYDMPAWLWQIWSADLGADATAAAQALQDRGPITLRVNLRRATRDAVQAILAEDGIICHPSPYVKTALHVVENERKVQISRAYVEGLIEVQDLASQAAVAGLELAAGSRVLDYCAGGGGKSLALVDLFDCEVCAHDISAARMGDIPTRSARAGVVVAVCKTADLARVDPFDAVFVDAPCSGSGTWRRAPEAKWALTQRKLQEYNYLQIEVITKAAGFVRAGGQLIYATCSVLSCENRAIIEAFVTAHPDWLLLSDDQRFPDATGDGFYHSVLQKT